MKMHLRSEFILSLAIIALLSMKGLSANHRVQNLLRKQLAKVESAFIQEVNYGHSARENLTQNGCDCIRKEYDCGCCVHMDVKSIKLDDTACVNITYLPKDYGFRITMSWDGKIVVNKTISARNPPPVCVGVPHLHILDACIDFYGLHVIKKVLKGCVKLELEAYHIGLIEYELGCFSIPLPAGHMKFVEAHGGLEFMHRKLSEIFKNVKPRKFWK